MEESIFKMSENLFLIFRKVHSLLAESEEALKSNLTRSHYEVLFLIYDLKKLQMSEIAKILSLSKPYMTALINRLAEDGLVERLYEKKDRRIIYISLTNKGESELLLHKKMIENHLKQKLIELGVSDYQELAITINRLKEMLYQVI